MKLFPRRWNPGPAAALVSVLCAACASYDTSPAQVACEQMLNALKVGQVPVRTGAEYCVNVAMSADEGAIDFQGEHLGDCLSEIESLGSMLDITAPSVFAEQLPACRALFEAARADGESCHLDLECPAGSHCTSLSNRCPGICERYVQEGGACGSEEGTCEYAEYRCEDATCVSYRQEGEACTRMSGCASGLNCVESICTPPQEDGGPCEIYHHSGCQEGFTCDVDRTCHPRGGEGADCLTSEEYRDILIEEGIFGFGAASLGQCTDGLACQAGVCAAEIASGGACNPADWITCVEGHYCDQESLTCEPPPAVGEPCSELVTCEGFPATYCAFDDPSEGVCTEKLGEGEPCSAPSECGAGLWCSEGSCEHDRCRDFMTSQGLGGIAGRP